MRKNDSRVSAATAADEAAGIALRGHIGALLDALDRSISALDRAATPTVVHEARVQARRLRVLLRVFIRPSAAAAVDRQIEALRDVGHYLDAIREADVAREEISELAKRCGKTTAPAFIALGASRRIERNRAARELKRHLNAAAWSGRIKKLRALTRDAIRSDTPQGNVEARAKLQFEKRRRRLLKALRRECNTPFKLHRLRLKIKFMRYLCEELSWSIRDSRQLQIKQLRALQTCLGNLRDGWQLQENLLEETRYPKAARELSARLAVMQRLHMREFRRRRKRLLRAWGKKGRS
jgi:CHAD domain-containing protein